jgi:hypothetical protein
VLGQALPHVSQLCFVVCSSAVASYFGMPTIHCVDGMLDSMHYATNRLTGYLA